MTYTCRCADGPARGKEFRDYGPSVVVEIPHEGRVLKYHLVSVLDRGCFYRFCGLSDKEEPSWSCLLDESTA